MKDPEGWARSVGAIVRGYVEAKLGELTAKVAALEARPEPDVAGPLAELKAAWEARFARLPPPPDLTPLTEKIAALEARPEPPAPDLETPFTTLREQMEVLFAKYVAELPPPAQGEPGAPGKSVTVEEVRPFIDAWLATWSVEWQRHADDLLQKAVDRWPRPRDGVDGEDGLGFDDLDVMQHEDLRTFTFRFVRGEQKREWTFAVPAMIDRGVFEQGKEYLQGDVVSWGGHMWVVKVERTEGKPIEGGTDWRLAVRRGRDGKGLKGEAGPKGSDGKDGVSRWMR